jgi:hypothetical protein
MGLFRSRRRLRNASRGLADIRPRRNRRGGRRGVARRGTDQRLQRIGDDERSVRLQSGERLQLD